MAPEPTGHRLPRKKCEAYNRAAFGRRNHRLHNRPFGIGQVARITKATAISSAAVFRLPHGVLSRELKRLTRNRIRFIGLKKLPDRLFGRQLFR